VLSQGHRARLVTVSAPRRLHIRRVRYVLDELQEPERSKEHGNWSEPARMHEPTSTHGEKAAMKGDYTN